jgi:hypothetical protein
MKPIRKMSTKRLARAYSYAGMLVLSELELRSGMPKAERADVRSVGKMLCKKAEQLGKQK